MSLNVVADVSLESEPCVLTWDDILFVGTEDGSIKTFDANLSPGVSWPAHEVQPFAIAALDGKLYTTSNDANVIRVWSAKGEKETELVNAGPDVGVLRVFDHNLYAGDEGGNVLVYEKNELKAKYNVLEEVKDLWYSPPFLFTVRDLDVTVTEIKPDESKSRFTTRHTMEGRAPVRATGCHLLVTARGGNSLRLHDNTPETSFKLLHEVKVSDMILTSLSVYGDFAWTGGWDGIIKRWKIDGGQLVLTGDLNVGGCVNSIVTSKNCAYAIISGKKVISIKAT